MSDRNEKNSHQRWYVLVTKAAAIFSLGLGLMVMTGWLAHIKPLLQITPSSVPVIFNTALGFIFCGLALWALVFGRRRLALVSGGVATGIGLLTLLQYSLNLDFGIDELFIRDYIRVATSHPGRMSPNSAICFTLAGAMLVLASWRAHCDKHSAIVGILSATVMALGLVAFVGHLLAIPTAYGWGQFTGMSLQVSIGFMVLGLGIFAYAWRESVAEHGGTPGWLPIIVGVGGATIAVLQWAALNGYQDMLFRETIRLHTKRVKDQVDEHARAVFADLEQMVKRWQDKGGTSKDEWEADARYYVLDDPSYQAAEWVDPSLYVRWVVPLKGNEAAKDRVLGFDEERRTALEKARTERKITITPPLELAQGVKGFLVCVPIFIGERFDGFILGVFRSQRLLDFILANVATDCGISISSGGDDFYLRKGDEKRYASQWGQETNINLYDIVWHIKVWPTPKLLAAHDSHLDDAVLAGGLLMALVLAATVALAQRARQHARELQREIAERKRGEVALRASEEKYRGLFETMQEGFVLCEIICGDDGTPCDYRFLETNPAFEEILGVKRAHATGKTVREIFPQVESYWIDTYGKVALSGVPMRFENYLLAMDKYFEVVAFSPKRGQFAAVFTDITERRLAECDLKKLSGAVEQSAESVFITNKNGVIEYVNPALERLTGYRKEEMLGKTPRIFKSGKHDATVYEHLWKTILAGETLEMEFVNRKKNGESYYEEKTISPIRDATGKITHFIATGKDITERKQAEEALRQAEQKYRSIFENAAEGIFQTAPEGRYISVNPALARMCGYGSPEELMASGHIVYVNPERRTEFKCLIEAQGFVEQFEYEVYRKDGGRIWLSENARAVRDASGAVIYYEGAVQDTTERKRVEERLLEQTDIINRAQDAIIIRNFEDECITFWNKGAERLYGWSANKALGKPIGELIFADAKDREVPLKVLVSTGEFHGETKQVAKDGREIIVDCRATLIHNPDGAPRSVLLINTDVTEQKKLETHLLRAQRLESIGTLASGVAHDLNNILTPILMCAQTLRSDLADEDRQSAISLIEESAQRGASIVKQVLTFARGIEGERVLIKPTHLIEEMIDIARKTFPKSIELIGRYPENLWTIQGDPTKLHQVLLNLAVNARDAMPSGGSLIFAAENFTADEHYAAMVPGTKAGPYVAFCVSDSGAGIPRATIDNIFDPFFTTKEVGKGTGLGLSTALGIVKSHGGFISVYSELGKGTTFKIFLPATMSDEDVQKSKTAGAPIQGNGERILVVDDEESILQSTRMIFEKHNYRVVSASDGPEALALFAQQMESIGGVLTDIAMPYMDGVALVRALKKMKSDIPIIASTGQGDQPDMAELQSLGVKNFLPKPYNTEKLLATVHDTLMGKHCEPPYPYAN